jgi:hypothetical protein
MPFLVVGVTGKLAYAYRDWIVGVTEKAEVASSLVSTLNAVAKQQGVLMPKTRDAGSDTLSFDMRDVAVAALKGAGDSSIPLMDYDGVFYECREVPSLD